MQTGMQYYPTPLRNSTIRVCPKDKTPRGLEIACQQLMLHYCDMTAWHLLKHGSATVACIELNTACICTAVANADAGRERTNREPNNDLDPHRAVVSIGSFLPHIIQRENELQSYMLLAGLCQRYD